MTSAIDNSWRTVGRRIAQWRDLQGMSQEQLAEAVNTLGADQRINVHTSQAHISMIETGARIITKRPVLTTFAAALGVAVTDLTGQPVPASTETDWATYRGVELIRQALLHPEIPGPLRTLDALTVDGDLVLRDWMGVEYPALGQRLPALLTEATIHYEQTADPRALNLIVRACVTGSLAYKPVGFLDLAIMLGARAQWAAGLLGDPVAQGAATYVTAQCALSAGRARRSLDLAHDAAATLDSEDGPDARTWSTMLWLHASLSAAGLDLSAQSQGYLQAAAMHAQETAGGSWNALEPTPTNVDLWRVPIALDNGNPEQAAHLASLVDVNKLRTPQRRARLYMDWGRGHYHNGQHAAAVSAFMHAYKIAPAKIAPRPLVREMVAAIARTAPARSAGSAELLELVQAVGVGTSIDE